jgi:hypothetical protein
MKSLVIPINSPLNKVIKLFSEGKDDEAIGQCEIILHKVPKDRNALLLAFTFYHSNGILDKALDITLKLIKHGYAPRMFLVEFYIDTNQYQLAQEELLESIKTEPIEEVVYSFLKKIIVNQ